MTGRAEDLADLSGRSALVTGAGDVGASIALALANHGAGCVAVADLDARRAETVAEQVAATGARGIPLAADLTDPDDVAGMAARLGELDVPIEILVNNAGMPPGFFEAGRGRSPFAESDPADWAPLLDLNLEAVLRVTHAFVRPMIERSWGRVITIVSDSARVGDRNMAVYAAAKGGASAFMRSLASEVGPRRRHGELRLARDDLAIAPEPPERSCAGRGANASTRSGGTERQTTSLRW